MRVYTGNSFLLRSFLYTFQSVAMELFLVSLIRKQGFLNFNCLWHCYNCSFIIGAHPQGKTVGEKKEVIQGFSLNSFDCKYLFPCFFFYLEIQGLYKSFSHQLLHCCQFHDQIHPECNIAREMLAVGRMGSLPLKSGLSKFLLFHTICLLLFTFQSTGSCLWISVQSFQL